MGYKQFLKNIKEKAEDAKSEADWAVVFKEIRAFNAQNPNYGSIKKEVILIASLALACFCLSYFPMRQNTIELCYVVLIGMAFLIGVFAFNKRGKIDDVSEYIFKKDLFWDNEITLHTPPSWNDLGAMFQDFNRGDKKRIVNTWASGFVNISNKKQKYYIYEYSYVEERVEVYYVNGKMRTRTVEDTKYRNGFIVDFKYAPDLLLSKEYSSSELTQKWESSSLEFNNQYNCYHNNELEIAKFLTPSNLLLLSSFDDFDKLNLEVNSGKLCISFDDEIIDVEREYGIEDIELFEKEIGEKNYLNNLEKLKKLIISLTENSDCNFS